MVHNLELIVSPSLFEEINDWSPSERNFFQKKIYGVFKNDSLNNKLVPSCYYQLLTSLL